MNTCNICVESYNYSTRAKIQCTKCEFECCKTCFKRYITEEGSSHIFRCMSCGNEFGRSGLMEALGKTFMATTFRDIREQLLFEIEKGYFPATQDIVERRLKIRALEKDIEKLDDIYAKKYEEKEKEIYEFRNSMEVMPIRSAIDKFTILQLELENMHDLLSDDRDKIRTEINNLNDNYTTHSNVYTMVCPKDGCNGMLSIENKTKEGHYKCIMCNTLTCCECEMIITEENDHICDPNVLATLSMIQHSSKPCPSCRVPIHRIEGCNQMFCTQCHASFDWRTLKLNNGAIHNPHHAQWLLTQRGRAREARDIQCGRELDIENVAVTCHHAIVDLGDLHSYPKCEKMAEYLYEAIRWGVHHQEVTIDNLSRDRYGHNTNQNLRVKLLMGEIDENTFKKEIQRRDKADSKRAELLHIVTAYRDALTDIVWPYYQSAETKTLKEWTELISEVEALEEYIDGCMNTLAKTYGSVVCYSIMSYIR